MFAYGFALGVALSCASAVVLAGAAVWAACQDGDQYTDE